MSDKLEIQITPEWHKIDEVRNNIYTFLNKNNISDDKVYSIGMIASELLENAIKYGNTALQVNLLLEIEVGKKEITVELKNKINETDKYNIHKLDQTLQWFRGFQSPFEAYIEKLKEISARDLEDRESGLGLVRIAYEGQGNIDFYLDENDMLCISVVVSIV